MGQVDFIGIGAQKAGTTWLYKQLSEFETISLPPIKEIHYFDRSKKYDSPNTLAHDSIFLKLVNRRWLRSIFRRLIRPVLKGDFSDFKWKLSYYFSSYDDDWYASLFNHMDGIKGEISPSYSILDIEDIKRIKELYPDVKLLLLLRDPIERVWSHFRYVHKRRDYGNLSKIKSFIQSKAQEERSDYASIIEKFSSVFPKQQLYIGFYDQIQTEPEAILTDIIKFLSLASKVELGGNNLHQRVNASKKSKIPSEALELLKEKYKPMLKTLSDRYGSYYQVWYDKHYTNS